MDVMINGWGNVSKFEGVECGFGQKMDRTHLDIRMEYNDLSLLKGNIWEESKTYVKERRIKGHP